MSAFLFALVGASLTLLVNALLRMWQYQRDAWNQRVDKLCDVIDRAASLGTEYYLEDQSTPPELTAVRPRNRVKLEAEILASNAKILGYMDYLLNRLMPIDADRLTKAIGTFHEALTGGSFQSKNARVDENRVRLIHLTGSELTVVLRNASSGATDWGGTGRFAKLQVVGIWGTICARLPFRRRTDPEF